MENLNGSASSTIQHGASRDFEKRQNAQAQSVPVAYGYMENWIQKQS